MKYTLIIQSSPSEHQGSDTGLRFARSLLKQNHEIVRLFFYSTGVYSANDAAVAPQDEQNLTSDWQALIQEFNLDAVVCIAAAVRRGVITHRESQRYGKTHNTLSDSTELSGLGQLISASIESDRVLTFGGRS